MKLFIPRYGQNLKLTVDWTFPLYFEHRNITLLEANGVKLRELRWEDCYESDPKQSSLSLPSKLKHIDVILPKDTVLQVDRIYIRQHDGKASDFDSMSFRIVGSGKGAFGKAKVRFWAKLDDCNNIECESVGEPKTKSSVKRNPNATDAVKAGDVVRYDYASCQEECPDHSVTHRMCKESMLILGENNTGRNPHFKVMSSSGHETWAPKAKVYVIEKSGVDVKEWIYVYLSIRFRAGNWPQAQQDALRMAIDKWVKVLAEDEKEAWRAKKAIDDLFYQVDRNRRLRQEAFAFGVDTRRNESEISS